MCEQCDPIHQVWIVAFRTNQQSPTDLPSVEVFARKESADRFIKSVTRQGHTFLGCGPRKLRHFL